MTSTVASIPVAGDHLCGLAAHGGLLWYSDAGLEALIAVEPSTGDEIRRLACPEVRTGLTATADGRAFVQVVGDPKRLVVVDAATGEVVGGSPNPRRGGELCGLHDTPAGLWTGYKSPPVVELRRHDDHRAVAEIPVDEDVADVTVVGRYVVFANHDDGRLNVVDPDEARIVASVPVRGHPTGLTFDGDRLWFCDHGAGRLSAVDLDLDAL